MKQKQLDKLTQVLESIKELGAYALSLRYGEGVGCDDGNIKPSDRAISLYWVPAGCVGEVSIFWNGTIKELYTFDFTVRPKKVPNPPSSDQWKQKGYYLYGTDRGVKIILSSFK